MSGVTAKVLHCSATGEEEVADWEGALADRIVEGLPVRVPPSYRGQRNRPGLFWAATDRRMHVYESLLELERLWVADFDPSVVALAAQPFQVTGEDRGVTRRHVPDLLLVTADRRAVVVDVKPAGLVEDPRVREQFAWTRRLCREKGWGYEVFSGASPVVVRNIRFLASGRRPELLPAGLVDEARTVAPGKATVGAFLRCRPDRRSSQEWAVALAALLWAHELEVDMGRRVDDAAPLQMVDSGVSHGGR